MIKNKLYLRSHIAKRRMRILIFSFHARKKKLAENYQLLHLCQTHLVGQEFEVEGSASRARPNPFCFFLFM
jgi:hypothetical protein